MKELTIKITDKRMLNALYTFTDITGVSMEEVVDTTVVEELLSTYLVEFFTTAMMDISLGQELRHPNIVTFVEKCRKTRTARKK